MTAEREDNLPGWRDHVDASIASLRGEITASSELARELHIQIADVSAKVQPVVDALETMEAGIRTMGRIGRLGERFGRVVLFLVALGVVGKFLFGGASWSDAVAAFSRALGR